MNWEAVGSTSPAAGTGAVGLRERSPLGGEQRVHPRFVGLRSGGSILRFPVLLPGRAEQPENRE